MAGARRARNAERVSRPREDETLVIRPAGADDMPAVATIFTHYVLDTLITFELQASR